MFPPPGSENEPYPQNPSGKPEYPPYGSFNPSRGIRNGTLLGAAGVAVIFFLALLFLVLGFNRTVSPAAVVAGFSPGPSPAVEPAETTRPIEGEKPLATVTAVPAGTEVPSPTSSPIPSPIPTAVPAAPPQSSAAVPNLNIPALSGPEIPCTSIQKFAVSFGSYKSNLGKKACLEGIVSATGAWIPGGAVRISFNGYSDIQAIIPAEERVRFSKEAVAALVKKKIQVHGVFDLSSVLRVPYLKVDYPEQINVIN